MTTPDELRQINTSMPFIREVGIEITAATADEVVGTLEWAPQRCTTAGLLHGGALMTLADSTGAVCAFLNLSEGAVTSTIDSNTNFLRALREGHAEAVSRPLHVGRTTIVVQTAVTDHRGKLLAHVTQTQAVIT